MSDVLLNLLLERVDRSARDMADACHRHDRLFRISTRAVDNVSVGATRSANEVREEVAG